MDQVRIVAFAAAAVALASACSAEEQGPTPEPTADLEQTARVASQEAAFEQATEAQGTQEAELRLATEQASTEIAGTKQAEDQLATRQSGTQAAIEQATASASSMQSQVELLRDQGYISTTSGRYYTIPDFERSWAQINWYQWWNTNYSPSDFVVRAQAEWESASDRANWFSSGCGFVFRSSGVADHYLAYLGLDGRVYFGRSVGDRQAMLGSSYYGKVEVPVGSAEIMLVVEDTDIDFFVNGEHVHHRTDQGLSSGQLAMTLLSGTNLDFGTRCRMSEIELWHLASDG